MGARKLSYNTLYYIQSYKEINSAHTELPNRHEVGNEYRYGFQGQEKDDEVAEEGNSTQVNNFQVRVETLIFENGDIVNLTNTENSRTTTHELGHGMRLRHFRDFRMRFQKDNLMLQTVDSKEKETNLTKSQLKRMGRRIRREQKNTYNIYTIKNGKVTGTKK